MLVASDSFFFIFGDSSSFDDDCDTVEFIPHMARKILNATLKHISIVLDIVVIFFCRIRMILPVRLVRY